MPANSCVAAESPLDEFIALRCMRVANNQPRYQSYGSEMSKFCYWFVKSLSGETQISAHQALRQGHNSADPEGITSVT